MKETYSPTLNMKFIKIIIILTASLYAMTPPSPKGILLTDTNATVRSCIPFKFNINGRAITDVEYANIDDINKILQQTTRNTIHLKDTSFISNVIQIKNDSIIYNNRTSSIMDVRYIESIPKYNPKDMIFKLIGFTILGAFAGSTYEGFENLLVEKRPHGRSIALGAIVGSALSLNWMMPKTRIIILKQNF